MRKLYNIIKNLSGHKNKYNTLIKSKDNEILTTTGEQLNRWKEHFSEVLETIHNEETTGVRVEDIDHRT